MTVRGLSKRYGDHLAVDGIDLEVHRGEVFALLGPNGAGKTTTIEILEGYRRRDTGQVQVLGSDPDSGGRAWRARLGIVGQTTTDAPELTVEELVRHHATFYPSPRDPDEVISSSGLDEKRRTRARALSGGQRRRLDVALGVIGAPELLFLDEPTTGFDPQARRQFWELVSGLRTGGTTILLTTHYLDEAEHLADRVGVIANGEMVEVGTPETLGGRAARTARVSWSDAEGPREVRTETPTQVLRELTARFGGEIPDLQVRRPSLEDVYLDLIGRAAATTTDDIETETPAGGPR